MKCLIVLALYSTFSVNFGYLSVAQFLPPHILQRGLSPLYTSLVFSVYTLSYIGCSMVITNFLIP